MAAGGAGGGSGARRGWRPWNLKAPEWRTAAWLGALLVAGLILLTARPAAAPAVAAPAAGAQTQGGGSTALAADPLQAQAQALEADLAAALQAVAGAGHVTVRVHLAQGAATDYAANTQVSDARTQQGTQVTTQHSVSRQLPGGGGGGAPPVQDVRAPEITGVLVVASGATDPRVRAELAAAAQAATGVPLYAVVVLPAAAGQ